MSQALTLFVVSTLQGKVEGGIKDGSKRD